MHRSWPHRGAHECYAAALAAEFGARVWSRECTNERCVRNDDAYTMMMRRSRLSLFLLHILATARRHYEDDDGCSWGGWGGGGVRTSDGLSRSSATYTSSCLCPYLSTHILLLCLLCHTSSADSTHECPIIPTLSMIRVRGDIIGHARINM